MRNNKIMRLLVIFVFLLGVVSCGNNNNELSTGIFLEERINESYISQLDRGDALIATLRSRKVNAEGAKNDFKVKKIETLLSMVDQVDKETAILIKRVDDLKIDVLKASGAEISIGIDDSKHLITRKYDSKDNPLKPSRLNLSIFDGSGTAPNNLFDKIDFEYSNFRLKICDLIGSYEWNDKKWNLKTASINNYSNYNDLEKQVNDMLRKQKVHPDDFHPIKHIYISLTCREGFLYNNLNGSSNIQALSILSAIQFDILKARASAINLLKSKISIGDFSYNKLITIVDAPKTVAEGEQFEVSVALGAYDTDNQPIVTGGNFTVTNGKGFMTAKGGSCGTIQKYSGTISIRSKNGALKEEPWSTEVYVKCNK